MKLENKTWLTGCRDDGQPTLKLNQAQREERTRYLERLQAGIYVEERRESCPLCGWGEGFLIGEKDRYGLPLRTVVCGSCRFLFTLNPLNQKSATQFYSEQYRRLYEGTDMDDATWETFVDDCFRTGRSMTDGLTEIIPILRNRDMSTLRLIEIGSGAGWNLAGFKERGVSVCGYDPDENCVKAAHKRGIEVRLGLIEEALRLGERADVVILNHPLEHVLDPVDVLEKCKPLLKPQGCLSLLQRSDLMCAGGSGGFTRPDAGQPRGKGAALFSGASDGRVHVAGPGKCVRRRFLKGLPTSLTNRICRGEKDKNLEMNRQAQPAKIHIASGLISVSAK